MICKIFHLLEADIVEINDTVKSKKKNLEVERSKQCGLK